VKIVALLINLFLNRSISNYRTVQYIGKETGRGSVGFITLKKGRGGKERDKET
jgi:hypothetical protein